MSNREIEAILRISSKLGSMTALNTLRDKLSQVNRQAVMYNRVNNAMERRGRAAWLAMSNLAGMTAISTGVVAAGLGRTYTAYADIERRLNRIAINAGQGGGAVSDMLKTVNRASHDYAMSQDQVAAGLETLVAAGRSADEAMKFLPSVTATAQAAGAEITDIATTADAVAASFGITGDSMQRAFDILVTGGKQGKFELKDMAQYLPSLAPAFAALGYKGEAGLKKLTAMLQTVRIRTGDASEAATATQNILQKMMSDETQKKFGKFGVDLRGNLRKALGEGRDVLDVFLDLTEVATKGDLSLIPQLFTDAQLQVGMRALLQGRKELQAFAAALDNVDGATLRDLNQVLSDSQSKIDRMASSWERFKTSLGEKIAPAASSALDFLSEGMTKADAINTELERQGLGFAQRRLWWGTHGFDVAAQDDFAWRGGYRSPQEQIAIGVYKEFQDRAAASKKAAEGFLDGQVMPHLERDKSGLPKQGPIPGWKDSSIEIVIPDEYEFAPEGGLRLRRDKAGRSILPATVPVPPDKPALGMDEFRVELDRQDVARRARRRREEFEDERRETRRRIEAPRYIPPGAGPDLSALPPVPANIMDPMVTGLGGAVSEFAGAVDRFVGIMGEITPMPSIDLPGRPVAGTGTGDRPVSSALDTDGMSLSEAAQEVYQWLTGAGDDLQQSGEAAGQSIRDAAAEINRAGAEGGTTFARMLEGVGRRIGAEAADEFRARVGSISVGVNVNGGSTRRDTGRSMPNAGSRPGSERF